MADDLGVVQAPFDVKGGSRGGAGEFDPERGFKWGFTQASAEQCHDELTMTNASGAIIVRCEYSSGHFGTHGLSRVSHDGYANSLEVKWMRRTHG